MSQKKSRRRKVVRIGASGPALFPPDNSKTCLIKQHELIKLLTNHASKVLGIEAPFLHHVWFLKADPNNTESILVKVVLEPTANIYEFPGKKRL